MQHTVNRTVWAVSFSRVSRGLVLACHPGPTLAVTVITALLAISSSHTFGRGSLVTAAVFTGQLSIGWSNDLIDAARDREVERGDKPIARGDLPPRVVKRAIAVALVLCVVLSLSCGWASGLVHLGLGVASGWAYNLGLKRTIASPLPYAIAFGTLPAVVTLALPSPGWPPAWMLTTGALLGVGAHLLNALPDLANDEATGVRGLPHRLGAATVRRIAPVTLLAGSVSVVLGAGPSVLGVVALCACLALTVTAMVARGRLPFLLAIGIAFIDVASLIVHA